MAWSADWSLETNVSQSLEFNSNASLSSPPPGQTTSSYTSLSGTAEQRTQSSELGISGDVHFTKYWGSGAGVLPQTHNLAGGLKAHYEYFDKPDSDFGRRAWFEAAYRQQQAAFALLDQFGSSTGATGTLNRLSFSGGFDRGLSAHDRLSASAETIRTTYSPGSAGTAFQDTRGSVTWSHRLSPLTVLKASSGGEWLNYDNASGTDIIIWRNQGGVETTLSPRLALRAGAGISYVRTLRGAGVAPHAVGFIGDVLLTYRPLKTLTTTLNASRMVGPSSLGSLFQTSLVGGSVTQQIDSASSISTAVNFRRFASTTATTDYASVSLSYNHRLTSAWTASVTYRYLHRFRSSGSTTIDPITGTPVATGLTSANSHSLMFTVTRHFVDFLGL
ncbi:MAG: hypothetical protein LBQ20_01455 [Rhodanobacter sp.]|jgi:hypothetical protein|nr:hypothetical protein [Rhodanobacter sp.]